MSLLQLPEIKAQARIGAAQFDTRPDALERWEPGVQAATTGDNTISIYDQIGESWDGSGMTAKRMAGLLRSMGANDVTVNINSPGGNFFEGVAVYNLLRQHKAKVTVNVVGLAASAASVIAMAGDEINMGEGAFLMIHNAWAAAVGNRHDMLAASEQLATFDEAMAEVYAARTGMTVKAAAALMDKETWIGATRAIADGFATGMLDSTEITDSGPKAQSAAVRKIEAALRASGMPRSAAQRIISDYKSSLSDSAGSDLSDSVDDKAAMLQTLITNLKA